MYIRTLRLLTVILCFSKYHAVNAVGHFEELDLQHLSVVSVSLDGELLEKVGNKFRATIESEGGSSDDESDGESEPAPKIIDFTITPQKFFKGKKNSQQLELVFDLYELEGKVSHQQTLSAKFSTFLGEVNRKEYTYETSLKDYLKGLSKGIKSAPLKISWNETGGANLFYIWWRSTSHHFFL